MSVTTASLEEAKDQVMARAAPQMSATGTIRARGASTDEPTARPRLVRASTAHPRVVPMTVAVRAASAATTMSSAMRRWTLSRALAWTS